MSSNARMLSAISLGVLLIAIGLISFVNLSSRRTLSATPGQLETAPLSQSSTIAAGKLAANFKLKDLGGNDISLASLRGKVVFLNIWATWCAPCRKEMPALDHLQATLGSSEFEVLPVSTDRIGMDAVDKFYTEIGIQHLARYVAPNANQALDTLGAFGFPATFLIDRHGHEIGRLLGPAEWDSPEMITFLKDVIAQQRESQQ